MARPTFETVDDYLRAQPPAVRPALKQVRGIIKKALPKAKELISYQIPAYRGDAGVIIYFAGFQEHYSIYPLTRAATKAFARELKGYETSGRGTVRFPLTEPVPTKLITRLAKFLGEERAAAAAAKKQKKKKKKKPRSP